MENQPELDVVIDLVRAETRAFVSGAMDPQWTDANVGRAAIDLTRAESVDVGLALLEGFATR